MTCFWDGLLKGLIHHKIIETNSNYNNFINYLKRKSNKLDQNIKVNGNYLSPQQKLENKEHIKNLDISKIHQGYDCSTFDPVLIFVCNAFFVNIIHKFMGLCIKYECEDNIDTLCFCSNQGHFWYVN